ncbi:MAG: DUF4429 domain-containing protein [Oscillospiraceae bacterium]|nr:DUF4429 domain-containing protein [Oscillospiraceae bacterium]
MKEYKFTGRTMGKCYVTINENVLTMRRSGFFATLKYGFTGEKSVLISSITGTQFKPSGLMKGYLQFIIVGSEEQKGSLIEAKDYRDENTIVFHHHKQNAYAKEIIEYIENYNAKLEHESNTTSEPQNSKYDELEKIKRLLEEGVLTEAEFEQEKEKILNS